MIHMYKSLKNIKVQKIIKKTCSINYNRNPNLDILKMKTPVELKKTKKRKME